MLSSISSSTDRPLQNGLLKFLASAALIAVCMPCAADQISLKTNLLYDATATINLGAEMRIAPRWSVDLSGNFNAWTFSDGKRWKHWLAQPEIRYWFCEATNGHFLAAHALGGQYNIGHLGFAHDFLGMPFSNLQQHRYQGWFAGAGIAYGYSWVLGKHWNMEAELGIGWAYTRYDIFQCEGCGKKTGSSDRYLFMPTKAAINLVYIF